VAKRITQAEFLGDKPFSLIPFIIIGENGESISTIDSDLGTPIDACKAAISAGSYSIAFGDIFASRRIYEGAVKHRIPMTIDETGWFNRYIQYYRQKLQNEEEAAARICRIGINVFGEASTTVTFDTKVFTAGYNLPSDTVMGEV
jgi:hypothetical protein